MILSRIWTAFIIISVVVAAYHWIFRGNEIIFNRMVTGKADDRYAYVMTGGIDGDTSSEVKNAFVSRMKLYGFEKKDSAKEAKYIISDDPNSDTVRVLKGIS